MSRIETCIGKKLSDRWIGVLSNALTQVRYTLYLHRQTNRIQLIHLTNNGCIPRCAGPSSSGQRHPGQGTPRINPSPPYSASTGHRLRMYGGANKSPVLHHKKVPRPSPRRDSTPSQGIHVFGGSSLDGLFKLLVDREPAKRKRRVDPWVTIDDKCFESGLYLERCPPEEE